MEKVENLSNEMQGPIQWQHQGHTCISEAALGFRTMYSSMHGEQIELSQAYAGALAGRSMHTSHAAALPQAVPSTAGGLSEVQPKCESH